MTERIYKIESSLAEPRLVRASNRHQALSHVANSVFSVNVASQDDLVDYLGKGIKVENYKPLNQELDFGEKA